MVVAYGRARPEAEELKADKSMKKRSKRNRAFLRPVVRPGFADAFSVPKEARRAARDNGYKKQPTFRVCCRHERKTPQSFCEACFDDAGRRRDAAAQLRLEVRRHRAGARARSPVDPPTPLQLGEQRRRRRVG